MYKRQFLHIPTFAQLLPTTLPKSVVQFQHPYWYSSGWKQPPWSFWQYLYISGAVFFNFCLLYRVLNEVDTLLDPWASNTQICPFRFLAFWRARFGSCWSQVHRKISDCPLPAESLGPASKEGGFSSIAGVLSLIHIFVFTFSTPNYSLITT